MPTTRSLDIPNVVKSCIAASYVKRCTSEPESKVPLWVLRKAVDGDINWQRDGLAMRADNLLLMKRQCRSEVAVREGSAHEDGRSERASARRDEAVDFPDGSGSILRNSSSGFSRCARQVYFRLDSPGCWEAGLCRAAAVGVKVVLGDEILLDSPGCWDAGLCRDAAVGFKVVLGVEIFGAGEEEETSRDDPEMWEDPASRSCQFQWRRWS